jgi:hypothetical protein
MGPVVGVALAAGAATETGQLHRKGLPPVRLKGQLDPGQSLSIATAYRYVHEGLDVIVAHAPDLRPGRARHDDRCGSGS